MSEFRQNPITRAWVLVAPNRSKRPEDFRTVSVMHDVPDHDSTCVFCVGKESLNKEVYRMPKNGDWQVRVIDNKFQALDGETPSARHKEFYVSFAGHGDHEVVVTRKHNEPIALQSIQTIQLSFGTFIERQRSMSEDPKVAYVQIFHNHGRDAGASLIHPHYQIMATPFVPPHVHNEMLGCYHYYQQNKSCVYCDIIKEEARAKERLVYEDEYFVVLSAYASRQPFETWILPKQHGARFEEMDTAQMEHLAYVLKLVLGRLYIKLADPPLNFYIHTMPVKRDAHTLHEEKSYHWHLTVFPRITIWAGFEYSTGIPVNPVAPEMTAEFLRGGL
jgi:UDPglucose--hexose-1-phosphate uridylyltransferase